MELTVEVFYVSADQAGARHDLAKFFEKKSADDHAQYLRGARSHSNIEVSMRVEKWVDQHIAHLPG